MNGEPTFHSSSERTLEYSNFEVRAGDTGTAAFFRTMAHVQWRQFAFFDKSAVTDPTDQSKAPEAFQV